LRLLRLTAVIATTAANTTGHYLLLLLLLLLLLHVHKQLHHCVRMANGEAGSGVYWGKDEWRGESGYFNMLAGGYAELCKAVDDSAGGPPQRRNSRGWFGIGGGGSAAADAGPHSVLLIDAANGVGACKVGVHSVVYM
jgi:hypothetical protein